VYYRDSITWTIPLKALHTAVLNMHWIQNRICGLQQRIPFPKNMTIPLRIFSRMYLRRITRMHLKKPELSIFIL